MIEYGELRLPKEGGVVRPTTPLGYINSLEAIVGNTNEFLYLASSRYSPFHGVVTEIVISFSHSLSWSKPALEFGLSKERVEVLVLSWLLEVVELKQDGDLEKWSDLAIDHILPDGYLPFDVIMKLPLACTDLSDEIVFDMFEKLEGVATIGDVLDSYSYRSMLDSGVGADKINAFIDYLGLYDQVALLRA